MIFNEIYPGRRPNIRACSQEWKPPFRPWDEVYSLPPVAVTYWCKQGRYLQRYKSEYFKLLNKWKPVKWA